MSYMYNKIFTKILDSSIWLETDATRLVWITLLAAMDEDGFCQFASVANLARRAVIDLPKCEEAVRVLESPDKNSADPENEGRRIERVPGGWMVLNAAKYRELVTRIISREQTRKRVAKFRARNGDVTPSNESVTPSEAVSVSKAESDVGKSRSAVASTTSQEDWLKELEANHAYSGIDVRREFGKMGAWCQTNRKEPTRRRFVNWLNRCDKPIATKSALTPDAEKRLNAF